MLSFAELERATAAIADQIGISDESKNILNTAALLHDLGKSRDTLSVEDGETDKDVSMELYLGPDLWKRLKEDGHGT